MKLGFLGGSFDPVHHGHLVLAQDVFEQLELDRLIFVPSARTPLKASEPELGAAERIELLRLAIGPVPWFDVSTVEIDRGGVSYTVDTARVLRERYPDDTLYWIIGQDQAAQLVRWHRIDELAGLVSFAWARRPGTAMTSKPLPGVSLHPVEMHQWDISSTEIRERVRSGRSVHFLTPPAVVRRIREAGCYGSGEFVKD